MAGIVDTAGYSNTDWSDKSINQPDIVAAQDAKFVRYPAGKYDLSNPHPGYGIDPNILNQYGHTAYPKWINVGGEQRIVKSALEEQELTGQAPPPNPAVQNSPWEPK